MLKWDLFELIAYAWRSANAQMGFHSFRSQYQIIAKLEAQGTPIPKRKNVRKAIRELIMKDRSAFHTCREFVVIKMVHGGSEHFWDGWGNRKTAQWYPNAEIIIDIQSESEPLVNSLFEITNHYGD